MDIHKIQTLFQNRSVKWSTHCLERMQERDILRDDVISCVLRGEIIEDYPNDFPYPGCLIFGYTTQMKLPSVWKSWYLRPSGSCRKFPSLTIRRRREVYRVFAASGAEIQGFRVQRRRSGGGLKAALAEPYRLCNRLKKSRQFSMVLNGKLPAFLQVVVSFKNFLWYSI